MIADSFVQLDQESNINNLSLGMSLTRNAGGLSDQSVDNSHWQELLRCNPFGKDDPDQVKDQHVTLQAYNNDDNLDDSKSDEEDVQYSADEWQDQKVEFYSKQQNSDDTSSDGGENHSCDDEELVIQEIKNTAEPSNNDQRIRTLPATFIQYAEFDNENLQDESEET